MQDAESNWAFDIFGFADATPGCSLSLLFCHLVKQSGLVQELMIEEAKLVKFARRIEKGYDSANPYHNRSGFCVEIICFKVCKEGCKDSLQNIQKLHESAKVGLHMLVLLDCF